MIYVDRLAVNLLKIRGKQVKSCHMFTDEDVSKLHDFAEDLGLKIRWLHISRLGVPHYDIVESIRKKAIIKGAREVTNREMVDICKKMRRK